MHSPSLMASSFSPYKDFRLSRATTVETIESPYRVRVKSVEKRFNSVHSSVESSTVISSEQFENKIRRLDERITEDYNQTDKKLKFYAEEVLRLEENMAAEVIANELLNERKAKEFNLVEAHVALELQNVKRLNKEAEKRILSKADERITNMRADFLHEYRKTEETRQNQTEEISKQVSDLQNGIKEEKALREKTQNTLILTLNQRLTKIKDTLASERKIRQKTETFLFDKIEEINANLSNQVTNEVSRREDTESQMLKLLEEACSRYEGKVKNYRKRYY